MWEHDFPVYPQNMTFRAPRGAAVFPLHSITADGKCGCGAADCARIGKHPAALYSKMSTGERIEGSHGHGVLTGRRSGGLVVIDCDTSEAIEAFCAEFDPPDTWTVATPRGAHFYFYTNEPLRNSVSELGPKIDVRGEGGFVVAAGSPHKSGVPYALDCSDEPAPMPPLLLARIQALGVYRPRESSANAPTPVDVTSPEGIKRLAMAGEYLKSAPAAIQGEEGSRAMWDVALYVIRTLELPIATAAVYVKNFFNPRCEPPWTDTQIMHKLEGARDDSDRPCGPFSEELHDRLHENGQPKALRGLVEKVEGTKRRIHDPKHVYKHVPGHNVPQSELQKSAYTMIVRALKTHPDWAGVWQYNEFSKREIAVDPPLKLEAETIGLTDADVSAVRTWFEANGITVGERDIFAAIGNAARANAYHPIKEYLEGLPVATVGLLDIFATKVLGIRGEDAEISSLFLKKTMVAAVRRILNPGTKVDTVLVLCGPQGFYKSTFVETLFGKDFTRSQMPDLQNKDASAALNGFWGVELSELDRILRSASSTVKEFLSRTYDDYRPSYGRRDLRYPRQAIFIGSANESDFLRDATGSRRFWPVEITAKIDLEWLRVNRDALWAEAYALAQTDYPHWLEDEAAAEAVREKFQQVDLWHDLVLDHCKGQAWVGSTADIYMVALAKNEDGAVLKMGARERERVIDILHRLGCKLVCKKKDGVVKRQWKVPDNIQEQEPSKDEVTRRIQEGRRINLGNN